MKWAAGRASRTHNNDDTEEQVVDAPAAAARHDRRRPAGGTAAEETTQSGAAWSSVGGSVAGRRSAAAGAGKPRTKQANNNKKYQHSERSRCKTALAASPLLVARPRRLAARPPPELPPFVPAHEPPALRGLVSCRFPLRLRRRRSARWWRSRHLRRLQRCPERRTVRAAHRSLPLQPLAPPCELEAAHVRRHQIGRVEENSRRQMRRQQNLHQWDKENVRPQATDRPHYALPAWLASLISFFRDSFAHRSPCKRVQLMSLHDATDVRPSASAASALPRIRQTDRTHEYASAEEVKGCAFSGRERAAEGSPLPTRASQRPSSRARSARGAGP